MSKFILSAFIDEYSASLDEQLSALRDYGIDNIEVRFIDGRNISTLSLDEARELKAKLDSHGIRVSAVGSPLGKIRLDGDIDGHVELTRHVCEIARILDTHYVRMFSFYAPEGRDIRQMRDEVFSALGRMLDVAEEYGVTLCHENEARIYGDTPERCLELLEHFGGRLRCVFDMGNFVLEGVDPYPEAYGLLKEYIEYFHIKDALFLGAIVPAGCGEAKIKEILEAHMLNAGNDFFVSLEPHLQTFSGLNQLVGREFENPYRYENEKAAFTDAVSKFRGLF